MFLFTDQYQSNFHRHQAVNHSSDSGCDVDENYNCNNLACSAVDYARKQSFKQGHLVALHYSSTVVSHCFIGQHNV